MTMVGLGAGIAGALGSGRLLTSFLYGITPADPLALAASATLMLGAALLACYLPAKRAAEADPIALLRAE